jgi:hypothetical protein
MHVAFLEVKSAGYGLQLREFGADDDDFVAKAFADEYKPPKPFTFDAESGRI